MLIQQLTVGMMGVCCYIVACEKTRECAVIDPGGDENQILAAIADKQLSLTSIIATHGHPDHVCSNRLLKEATGAQIVMHEVDAEFFARPETEKFFSVLGLEASPAPDLLVKDDDVIMVGEEALRVIHTPGHTPGGICLYHAPDLFTGDTLFVGGLGRTDFPGGSHEQLISSITTRLLVLPDETVVWPGHGYGGSRSTIGSEKRENPYIS
ncbi:MAG: MBL fold metallo-hydrolase [Desulfobulbaceae bacterium]|uniref:MBL fold metallo-hydrolase n=1 Tax=Candidatus Desulfatifera sulfidica TaxID=2841691 RepID=A0A8J6T998_9BACT|nr:MBL fold metallo-hydrolase [Candidatus Desulfatifera sulfidica]